MKKEKYTFWGTEYEDELRFKRWGSAYMNPNALMKGLKRHGSVCPGNSKPLSEAGKVGVQCSCGCMVYIGKQRYEKILLEKDLSIDDMDYKETLLCELMEIYRPKTFTEKVWLKL